LQRLLVDAVRDRLGASAIRIGQRVTKVGTADAKAQISVTDLIEDRPVSYTADVAICADGIRSPSRDSLYGAVTPLASNGWVMYRGVTASGPFLSGGSMVIIGDETQRVVVYPIADGVINWLLVRPRDAARGEAELGNWNLRFRPVRLRNS
jgi:2-polyprenyl-6-methoxyphenol hydroxylase-like FAD-dependent oxidoreductase